MNIQQFKELIDDFIDNNLSCECMMCHEHYDKAIKKLYDEVLK